MRTTLLVLAAAGAIVLAGGASSALARTAATQAATDMHEQMTGQMAAHDLHGHDSAALGGGMDAMHTQMMEGMGEDVPAELLERCEELHAEMSAHHAPGAHHGTG